MFTRILYFGLFLSLSTTSIAQDIAFSTYQAPDVVGYFTNNGRITDQQGELRQDIHTAFHGRNVQFFFNSTGWFSQIKKSVSVAKPSDIPNIKAAKGDTLLVQRVHFNWLLTGNQDSHFDLSEPAGPPVNVYRENFSAENLRAHQKMIWHTPSENIRFEFSCLSAVKIKYNIIVAAGAEMSRLKCVLTGADEIHLKPGGKTLEIITAAGTLEEHIPQSWQIKQDGSKKPIEVTWSLQGDTAGFNISDEYDPLLPLVIDPWSTYLGGTGGDGREFGEDVATDASLNVYATGNTTSLFNIATTGTFQTTLTGAEDAYLIRYNSNGTRQWCTYYGGITSEYASSVSASGTNLLVMGISTYSSGLGTTGTHQPALFGDMDALVCRMNPANGQRVWATYYGGGSRDDVTAIQTDASGNIYVTGTTSSNTGIASTGAFKTTLASSDQDAYLVRFTSSGARTWGTYYGGGNAEAASDVAVDVSGNIIIGGLTSSLSNIATAGTHQTTRRGLQDGFIVRFNSAGARLWGTYYGGTGDELIFSVATDGLGRVYGAGYTSSTTFIATAGAYKTTLSGTTDGFMFRLNSNGTMNYATYYGGENDDGVYGIKTDAANNTYFCGYTTSTTGISTSGAQQTVISGSADAFTGKFNNAGNRLWCTYYGGPEFEFCRNMTIDASANVIITGYTTSSTGIAINAAQSSLSGVVNAFIAKYTTNGVLPVTWLNVSAKSEKDDIIVEWSTSTETNNDYFTVEHSTNGTTFTELGNVNGAGTSSVVNLYQFLHNEPLSGTQYYRIRQTDFNGTFDFSDIVVVNLNTTSKQLTGYVSSGNFILKATDPDDAWQWVSLINSAGQNVTPSGAGQVTNISHLPEGVYTAVLQLNGEPRTLRFIK